MTILTAEGRTSPVFRARLVTTTNTLGGLIVNYPSPYGEAEDSAFAGEGSIESTPDVPASGELVLGDYALEADSVAAEFPLVPEFSPVVGGLGWLRRSHEESVGQASRTSVMKWYRYYDRVPSSFDNSTTYQVHEPFAFSETTAQTSRSDPRDVARAWFPILAGAPSEASNKAFDVLVESSTPSAVLGIALQQYRSTGRDRILSLAHSLLSHFEADAWPVLEQLAHAHHPLCLQFIGLIAGCPGVEQKRRLRALNDLAQHPDPEVRWAVLDEMDSLPANLARDLLLQLATDGDEAIREAASDRLDRLPE